MNKSFQKIKSFPLFELGGYKGGLIVEQLTERDYPIGGIAQRTVGYERYDDFGNSMRPGLDGAFGPKYLKGKSGSRFSQKIGQGQWKPVSDDNLAAALATRWDGVWAMLSCSFEVSIICVRNWC